MADKRLPYFSKLLGNVNLLSTPLDIALHTSLIYANKQDVCHLPIVVIPDQSCNMEVTLAQLRSVAHLVPVHVVKEVDTVVSIGNARVGEFAVDTIMSDVITKFVEQNRYHLTPHGELELSIEGIRDTLDTLLTGTLYSLRDINLKSSLTTTLMLLNYVDIQTRDELKKAVKPIWG